MFIHVFFMFPETKGQLRGSPSACASVSQIEESLTVLSILPHLPYPLPSSFFQFCLLSSGKSLEEMDEIFESGIPAWKSGKLSKHSKLQEIAAAIQRGEAVDGGKVLDKTDSQSDTTPDEKEKQLA